MALFLSHHGKANDTIGYQGITEIIAASARMAFVLLLDFGVVANAANFTLFLTFMVVIAALIVLKFRLLRAKRPL